MKLGQALKMSAKSIFSNIGRSILTMLGVIIGLAAVIILVSYAQGQNMALNRYYESLGQNRVEVSANIWYGNVDVTTALYEYCLTLNDLVLGITPNGYIYNEPPIKYGAKTLARDWDNYDYMTSTYPQIALGNDQYGICNNFTVEKGRELSYLDSQKENQVCVLGSATAQELFSFADPVGQTITIDNIPFLVVGVYKSKSGGITVPTREDGNYTQEDYLNLSLIQQDRIIVLPHTMTRIFNDNQPISEYVIKAKNSGAIRDVITLVSAYLSGIITQDNGYYYVQSPDTYIEENNEANALQQRFLAGIAAISLIVGGIGIMNIMLVTVTERTREIGIRKAIGAERKSIILQFLIEAVMICGIGGILGIVVGYIGTLIICKINFNAIIYPALPVTIGAFLISLLIGIVFGLYPAAKASGLQPVDALRAE